MGLHTDIYSNQATRRRIWAEVPISTRIVLVAILWSCLAAIHLNAAEILPAERTVWKLWRGRKEASLPTSHWREITFNDTSWENAVSPIYYSTAGDEPPFFEGEPFAGTRLGDMQNGYTSVCLRRVFNLASATNVEELTLRVAVDDGFIAWLNGTEVARYNVPDGDLAYDAVAFDSPTEPVPFLNFPVPKAGKLLHDGANILAVQAFNRALESSDFGIMVGLDSTVPLPPLPDTKFDHDRGIYSGPFELVIRCADPAARIYYTVNGSSPSSTNGVLYTLPVVIRGTTVIRARAEKPGFKPSSVDTQTYLFPADVVRQSADGAPPPGWPAQWGENKVDYGMDPDIVDNPLWKGEMVNALKAIPTVSLVTDLANLFDRDIGIYANANGEGKAWERSCSIEWLRPDGGRGFQENCGVRIRGGFSRSSDNPKHSFRFYFRSEYGASALRYPIFGVAGASSHDQFDLRTTQDGSWAYLGVRDAHFLNDPFARDTLLALGQPGERGGFVHVYINGQYWGLYNTCERPEASYASRYFGGEAEDYDVLKPDPQSGYVMTVTDGNASAWNQLWQAATNGFSGNASYFAVQGRDPNGVVNPGLTNLLDMVNLVDFMLTIIWIGDVDGPISGDLNNGFLNNYYAFRSRRSTEGFRFVTHDAELSLLDVNDNRAGLSRRGDPARGDGPDRLNPHYLWSRLRQNAEFRLLIADRIQKHFFNAGALTVEACTSRFRKRMDEIDRAVLGESARWGDAQYPSEPITAEDWKDGANAKLQNYFPDRPGIVLKQLRNQGLWPPSVGAPHFSVWGGELDPGAALTVTHTNKAGVVWFTLDGNDPREPGGKTAGSAIPYQRPVSLDRSVTVKARVLSGDNWSPLAEATFHPRQDLGQLRVTELMYHPPAQGTVDGDEFEYIELKNQGEVSLDLGGLYFSAGIHYAFTNGTVLGPSQFFLLAKNLTQFAAKYPGIPAQGVFSGNLENSGETITLSQSDGSEVISFAYGDRSPWPSLADGNGYSLVLVDSDAPGNLSDPGSWRVSARVDGSPGTDDAAEPVPRIKAASSGKGILLSWPNTDGNVVLEASSWLNEKLVWEVVQGTAGGSAVPIVVTNVPGSALRFFRLRKN